MENNKYAAMLGATPTQPHSILKPQAMQAMNGAMHDSAVEPSYPMLGAVAGSGIARVALRGAGAGVKMWSDDVINGLAPSRSSATLDVLNDFGRTGMVGGRRATLGNINNNIDTLAMNKYSADLARHGDRVLGMVNGLNRTGSGITTVSKGYGISK